MRDNLMSTPWRSQLLCPRRNVLIKIKRNFFDFDFIKCDLNELGHIFPQHTLTHIHIHVYSMFACMQCRLIKQTALCSRLRNIYNSAGRVYIDKCGGVRGLTGMCKLMAERDKEGEGLGDLLEISSALIAFISFS